jgi:hypothetical protein
MSSYSFVAGALAGAFSISAFMKLVQPQSFRLFLESLVAQKPTKRLLAVGTPIIELGIACSLLTPSAGAGAIAAGVLSMASAAVAIAATRRPQSPGCGCFGSLDAVTPHSLTLIRALGFLTAAAYCIVVARGLAAPTLEPSLVAIGAVAGIAIATSMSLLGQIVQFRVILRRLVLEPTSAAEVR